MSHQFQVVFTGGIFILTYAMIMLEKIHRAVVAMAGAAIVVIAGVLSQTEAFNYVDFNTIGLLIGMMMIVGITRHTGVFEYMTVYAAKAAQGSPARIMIFLASITAGVSAFLDNVTTVLLIVPVTLSIARSCK
jgi:Na+/H+ antiporter NhaD/arsenite permease-like protein